MADEKISQLSDGGAPQNTDEFPIARTGSTLSLTFANIAAAITGGVSSVFGRTGAVTAQSGDYTAAQVGALPSTETLDQIATANATAANVNLNSHKITNLTNGSGAQDAAAFGQIPTALPPNGTAGGDLSGSYPNPAVKAITETSGPTDLVVGTVADGQFLKRVGSTLVSAAAGSGTVTSVTATDTSIVVAGTGAAPTIATGTLDVIAADHPPAANWSNNSHKITSLSNGSAASDAAAFGQIPTALPPNGSAGGDLSGTYPNPAVAKITETSGPTSLTIGTVADGQFLKRSGSTLVSSLGFTKIYDNTLSSAGNFDTGAASIPSGYSAIQIVLMGRGTVSSPQVDNLVRLNNDSGSSYLDLAARALNASTVNAVADAASTSAEFGQVTAATGTANYAGVVTGLIVGYDQTTFFKQCSYTASFLKDTTPSGGSWVGGFIWISTAAITRIGVTASGTTYVTGTRLIVYGLP